MIGIPSPEQTADSIQVGGKHYKEMTIQPWAAMEAWLSKEEFIGFLKGNAIKYLARANSGKGSPEENHSKAKHYLDKLKEIQSQTTSNQPKE